MKRVHFYDCSDTIFMDRSSRQKSIIGIGGFMKIKNEIKKISFIIAAFSFVISAFQIQPKAQEVQKVSSDQKQLITG